MWEIISACFAFEACYILLKPAGFYLLRKSGRIYIFSSAFLFRAQQRSIHVCVVVRLPIKKRETHAALPLNYGLAQSNKQSPMLANGSGGASSPFCEVKSRYVLWGTRTS